MAKRMYVIETYKRRDGKWDWRCIAPNKNIIATSGGQGYERKDYCEKTRDSFISAIVEGRIQLISK